MKANGIGRPSTRAAIIETLLKRKYIVREKKNIKATAAGIALIDTIKIDLLKSAKLTGLWENKLRKIESGEYKASDFVNELKQLINEIVIDVLNDNTSSKIVIEQDKPKEEKKKRAPRKPSVKSFEEIACPLCGNGHLIKGKAAFGCSNYVTGCTFRLPFTEFKTTPTPAQVAKKVKSVNK